MKQPHSLHSKSTSNKFCLAANKENATEISVFTIVTLDYLVCNMTFAHYAWILHASNNSMTGGPLSFSVRPLFCTNCLHTNVAHPL